MRKFLAGLAIAALCAATPAAAQDAEKYPERPVTVVVPYAPGGSTDAAARLMGPLLNKVLGQPFVVDNKPGAAGVVGTQYVAKSKPDGYTILVHTSVIGIHPAFHPGLPYDTENDLVPVSTVSGGPFILVVNPQLPVNSVQELVDYAKANPGTLNFGSAGAGSSGHLIGEQFKKQTGIDMTHIPYPGGGPSQTGLIANEVQLVFDTLTALPLIREGKMKALAVTSAERWDGLPDVPTIAEAGFPDAEVLIWIGAFAPKGTPEAITNKLSAAIAEAVHDDNMQTRLKDVGMFPIGSTPAEARKTLQDDIAKWRDLKATADIDM